jgi:hypothetical protein
MHPFGSLLLVAALGLAAPRPAEAGCDAATPFELFDRAERVVIGTIATPLSQRHRHRRGQVVLDVTRSLKGQARGQLVVRASAGLCAPLLDPGARVLLFLDRQGNVVGDLEGELELPADPPDPKDPRADNAAWPARLEAWGQAADDLAHLDLLMPLLEADEHSPGHSAAADYVVNTPRLLPLIDAPRRQRIAAALADDRWHPNYALLILARLRAPELGPLLDAQAWSYEEEIRAMLAADRFAAVTDRQVLAAAMLARDATPASRAAALDRCEQLRGEAIERYVMYLYDDARWPGSVDWRHAAAACRR